MKIKVNKEKITWWLEYSEEHRYMRHYKLFEFLGQFIPDSPHKDSFRLVGAVAHPRRLKFCNFNEHKLKNLPRRQQIIAKKKLYCYFEQPGDRETFMSRRPNKPYRRWRRSILKRKALHLYR